MKKNQCPECGEYGLRKTTAELIGRRKGESFPIQTAALVCSDCGFKTIPRDSMGEFALHTADAYREAHGLFTSQQIKEIRACLRMNQQEFAKFLHVGVASVKRWELGEIQDAAMNRLIVLSVDAAKREKQETDVTELAFGAWDAFEQTEEYLVTWYLEDLEPQPVGAAGLAGLANGPPFLVRSPELQEMEAPL
jgi:putative zinc finger/helix-turn-helix YgiT family protein